MECFQFTYGLKLLFHILVVLLVCSFQLVLNYAAMHIYIYTFDLDACSL